MSVDLLVARSTCLSLLVWI